MVGTLMGWTVFLRVCELLPEVSYCLLLTYISLLYRETHKFSAIEPKYGPFARTAQGYHRFLPAYLCSLLVSGTR